MNVIAGIAEFQAVAASLVHGEHRLHRLHRKSFAVERPLIEPVECGVVLDDGHLDRLVRLRQLAGGLAEARVIPAKWFGLGPLRLALHSCVFDDDAHTMPTIVVVEIAHHPYTGMIHLNDGADAFGRAEPQHWDLSGRRNGIAVERHHSKDVARQSEASDLACTCIQDVHENALAPLDAERIARPKHLAVDAESLVADFIPFALFLCFLVGAFPHLLQFLDRFTGEKVHRYIAAAAEGSSEFLHHQKDLTVIRPGTAVRLNVERSGLAGVGAAVQVPAGDYMGVIETKARGLRYERNAAHAVCRDKWRTLFCGTVNVARNILPVPMH